MNENEKRKKYGEGSHERTDQMNDQSEGNPLIDLGEGNHPIDHAAGNLQTDQNTGDLQTVLLEGEIRLIVHDTGNHPNVHQDVGIPLKAEEIKMNIHESIRHPIEKRTVINLIINDIRNIPRGIAIAVFLENDKESLSLRII